MNSELSNGLGQSRSPDADLARRRGEIRHRLAASNSATVVALLVSVGLALAAGYYAFQARQANERTRAELWKSQRAHAMALRLSGKVGRREESLGAIAQAVSIKPSPDLRDEAIATLALMDLQPGDFWQPMPSRVTTVGFSCDLEQYAWGDAQGRVTIYRTKDRSESGHFTEVDRAVMSLNFSADGRYLAARFQEGALQVWDMDQAKVVFGGHFPLSGFNEHSVVFHPRAPWLLAGTTLGFIQVLDLRTWQTADPLPVQGSPASQCFNQDGTRLAVAVSNRIEIWDFASRQRLQSLDAGGLMTDLAWHPAGQILAAGHSDGNVTLLDRRLGRRMTLHAHTMPVTHVMFDPGGEVMVSTSWDGTSRFWDAGSGHWLLTTQAGYAAGFDAAGTRIFYFKEGLGLGDWKYSPASGLARLAVPVGISDRVLGVDFSPDGEWVIGTTSEGVHSWRRASRAHSAFLPLADAQRAVFRADGTSLVASSGSGLHELPFRPGSGTNEAGIGPAMLLDGAANRGYWLGFATIGDGEWFATASPAEVSIVDLKGGVPQVRSVKWSGPRRSAAVSPDGRFLATSVWKGGGTRVWDLTTSRLVANLKDEGGLAEFSPNGKWLVVGAATEFLFYETASWKPVRQMRRDVANALSGIAAFSPASGMVALTHTARQVRLVSPDLTTTLATLDAPHAERITDLCFSRDGRHLAVATDNRIIHLWDLCQLRRELAGLGLDWAADSKPAVPGGALAGNNMSALRAIHPSRFKAGPLWLVGTGSGLALLFALFSIRHHRKLVDSYEAVEVIAEQRRRESDSAQAQLIQTQKMKALGTLAAGVAHDFNNLLSIIRMSNQLLARQVEPSLENKEELESIEQAVRQGKGVVRSILGYSRQSGAPDELYFVPALVSESLAMLSQGFLSGIVLNLELDAETPPVRGDRSRLEQILLNLVVNAAEAMQGHGHLTLSVREPAGPGRCLLPPRPAPRYVELAVRDSGPGIAAEHLPRVFEPFFSTKKSGADRGVGLGLATVYTIAEHDGLGLGLVTEAGVGTTFRILIPAAEAGATVTSPST